jgi:hypothetical protein
MAAKKKTPAGLNLEDFVKVLKEKNLPIPPEIQHELDQRVAPNEKPKAKTPEPPKLPAKKPKASVKGASKQGKIKNESEEDLLERARELIEQEGKMDARILAYRLSISRPVAQELLNKIEKDDFTNQSQTKYEESPKNEGKRVHSSLQNFLGKDTAKKLIKQHPNTPGTESVSLQNLPELLNNKEKKKVPATSADIKAIRASVDEIHEYLFGKKKPLGSNLIKSRRRQGGFLKSFVGGLTTDRFAEKVFSGGLPKFERAKPTENKTPSTVERVPTENVPNALSNIQMGNSDQAQAQHTKEFVQKEEDAKALHQRIDKIQTSIDDMKKKLDTLLGRSGKNNFGSMLGTILQMLGLAWKAIRAIGANVGKVLSQLGKLASTIFSNVWSKLKPILARAGFAETGAALGAAVLTAGQALAIDRMAKYEYDRAASPFKKLEQDYGLKALGNGNFELKGKKYHNYGDSEVKGNDDLPEEYKTLINAKTGDTRGGTSKRAQEYIQKHEAEFEALKVKPTQPPRALPTALSKATETNNTLESDKDSSPQVVVVKGGNKTTVVPTPSQSPIGVVVSPRNPEPSADSLNAGLFDAPQGYGAMYRI